MLRNNSPKVSNAPNVGIKAWQQCPVKDAKRWKVGHYIAFCFSTKMAEITEDSGPDESSFLGAIDSNSNKQWLSTIRLNFLKLDRSNCYIENTYRKVQNFKLQKLTWSANSHLSVIIQFTGILFNKSTECEQEIFVVKNLETNLLGYLLLQSYNWLSDHAVSVAHLKVSTVIYWSVYRVRNTWCCIWNQTSE